MLENEIKSQLNFVDNRAILFAGPVLDNENDPIAEYNQVKIQYPLKFWKIVVVNDENDGLTSYGFILDQSNVVNKFGLEVLDFSQFKSQQATIQAITAMTGVIFDSQLYDSDILKNTGAYESGYRTIRKANELFLRRDRTKKENGNLIKAQSFRR
jgi:DNA/RNA endonuclease G (NUC1)